MEIANRTLTAEVVAALTYWPGIIGLGRSADLIGDVPAPTIAVQ